MLCDDCKTNQATYHSIKKYNGISTEKHLCGECYLKQAGTSQMQGLNNLFSGFSGFFEAPRRTVLKCRKCGTTGDEFLESGYVGCADCYKELEQIISPVVQRVQNGILHTGKSPRKLSAASSVEIERERLQAELDRAVKTENFEQAMVLRDKLRELNTSHEA